MNDDDYLIGVRPDTIRAKPIDPIVASVDGMAGPEAWAILAPLGYWLPKEHPLLVKEVVVEPGDRPGVQITLRFIGF